MRAQFSGALLRLSAGATPFAPQEGEAGRASRVLLRVPAFPSAQDGVLREKAPGLGMQGTFCAR